MPDLLTVSVQFCERTPSSDAPGETHMSICALLVYLLNSLNTHAELDSPAEMYTNFSLYLISVVVKKGQMWTGEKKTCRLSTC